MELIRVLRASAFALAFTASLHAAPSPGKTQQFTSPDQVPDGLQRPEWQGIRSAHESWRHGFAAVEGGHTARTPGQQWRSHFDARGFLTQPDGGGWSWGMELRGYGFAGHEVRAGGEPRVEVAGQQLTRTWDAALAEWYVNDARGLEHGFTVARRPEGAAAGGPLGIDLALRGTLKAQVSGDGQSVRFVDGQGGVALSYGGLKAWDAEGKTLPVRMAAATEGGLRFEIEEVGARYPITVDPVAQQAYVKASNTGADDRFGYSLAISGDTVVIGAFKEDSNATGVNGNQADNSATDSGAAYVFVRSGGTWTQQAYLKASNTGAGDQFGYAVAVSGDTIVVGARKEDSSATGVNGNQANESAVNSGAAYLFVRSGTTWTQQAYLKATNTEASDGFGASVAVSGDTVVVGGYLGDDLEGGGVPIYTAESSSATGVNGNQADNSAPGSGAAYVFARSGTTWIPQAYLKASNTETFDAFGFSVAISGTTIVVGAPREASNATGVNGTQGNGCIGSGAAYVFNRTVAGVWVQQAYLKASTVIFDNDFGWSVAISGDTVAVGAPRRAGGLGSAYVFTRDLAGVWSPQTRVQGGSVSYSYTGWSVAVSGDTLIAGAPGSANFGNPGLAFVYTRNLAGVWTLHSTFVSSNNGALDSFGSAVAIAGDTVLGGAGSLSPDYAAGGGAGEASDVTGINSALPDNNNAIASGAAYIFTGAGQPDIAAEQPAGTALATGGTKSVAAVVGSSSDTTFTLRNTGSIPLTLTGTPSLVALTGSNDFTVTAQPASSVSAAGSTTFTVHFAPATSGVKTAALSIPSNDPDETPYLINLTGHALTTTTDTDGDGMSDAAEFNLAALGFDWQASQPALVAAYFANASNNGLYTTAQVQALNVGVPLLQRNATTGKFTLTIGVKKTTVLGQPFLDFPMTGTGTGTFINGVGKLEFEFPSSDNAAFFRLQSQ